MDKSVAKNDPNRLLAYGALGLFFLAVNFTGSTYMVWTHAIIILVGLALYALGAPKLLPSEKKPLLIFGIPLIIFAILDSFSQFWLFGGWLTAANSFFSCLSFVVIFILGFFAAKNPKLSFFEVLGAIVAGLTLLVLINTLTTLILYGPFYLVRYAGYERFYDGIAYPIANEYALIDGFTLTIVSPRYALQFSFVLASLLGGLLFASPKKDRNLFILCAVGGGVGLLSLLLALDKGSLILWAIMMGIACLFRFAPLPQKAPRYEKIIGIVLLSLLGIFVLVVFLNGLFSFTALNSGFLGRIFNNRITKVVNQLTQAMFFPEGAFSWKGIFGAYMGSHAYWDSARFSMSVVGSNFIWEIVPYYEGGPIAFIAFLVLLVFGILSFRNYLHKEEKISVTSVLPVLFVLAYVCYASFRTSVLPNVESPNTYISPLSQSPLFLLSLFLLGYCYTPIAAFRKARLSHEEDD